MRTPHALSWVFLLWFCGGATAAEPAPFPHEPPKKVRYTVTVTSDEGKIANINLRGGDLPAKGIDFKADVKAYSGKLKELAAKHDDKTKPAAIDIEIDLKLLQRFVVELIDASTGAGFTYFLPIPLDKSKR